MDHVTCAGIIETVFISTVRPNEVREAERVDLHGKRIPV